MGTQSFAFTVDLCHPCAGGPDGHKENNKATGRGGGEVREEAPWRDNPPTGFARGIESREAMG